MRWHTGSNGWPSCSNRIAAASSSGCGQLTGGVALAGALIVVLAASGAIPAARLAIGVPVLLAGVLMAILDAPAPVRDAGQHAIDLRKAISAAALALLSLLGALTWRPLGYACLLALAVAAVPVVSALRTRRRRDAAPPQGRGPGAAAGRWRPWMRHRRPRIWAACARSWNLTARQYEAS